MDRITIMNDLIRDEEFKLGQKDLEENIAEAVLERNFYLIERAVDMATKVTRERIERLESENQALTELIEKYDTQSDNGVETVWLFNAISNTEIIVCCGNCGEQPKLYGYSNEDVVDYISTISEWKYCPYCGAKLV